MMPQYRATGRRARPYLSVSRLAWGLLSAMLLLGLGNAGAQSRFEEEFDDEDKPWKEIEVQLPPAPRPENLVPLNVTATSSQKFFVDTSSISVGADGVVRYVLVAAAAEGGARNVSYEGIRCETWERKLYAFGQADGSWSRSRRDQWERIRKIGSNQHHMTLAKDYICEGLSVSGKAADIVERLRYERTLNGNNYR
ncbi:CNP1-like family protein [Noviherbaspirillum aridicola]|uniref:CNP1-like uncharacterized domain-containing protein n=1 Tax=Noviherbaspirillum aridicola TaxID=2849687 RepID=A0ABQ4Q1P0_9BURK|nr:CNP1-like family protein [Noviherbaspirillum aridicola]GIZ50966.1 hypothetical protein NCCP691_09800 [Noviherbaspirillum aridicola]